MKYTDKIAQENRELIAKKLSGEQLSEKEMAAFDALEKDASGRKQIEEVAGALKKTDVYFRMQAFDTQKAWDKVQAQIQNSNQRTLYSKLIRIAAIFVLVVATAVFTYRQLNQAQTVSIVTASTELEGKEVELPDGSVVVLNYNSKLTYNKDFNKSERYVELEGEAFFDVARNTEKPFVIETKDSRIRVLGTSFNVKAYDGEAQEEVFVKTGRVEFSDKNKLADKVILTTGETGTLIRATGSLFEQMKEQSNGLAWLTRDIEFRVTTLKDAISIIEHVYNLDIVLDKQVDPNQIITASFKQQEADYIIDVMALTLDLDVAIKDNRQYILSNK